MDHDSMWSALREMDNYLNNMGTNADLEPPSLVEEIIYSGVNDHSTFEHTSSIKEGFTTNGINFCTLLNSRRSTGQSSSGPSHKKFIEKKGIAEGSILHTLVNNQSSIQSAGVPSQRKSISQEEIQTEISKLCTLVNSQISSQKGIICHENFIMEEQIGKQVSKLCTLVNNNISSQSEIDLSPDNFFTEKEIIVEIINLLVNNQTSIKCACGYSREYFVTNEENVTQGSNMCTLISDQRAIGSSREELTIEEESTKEGSSLFSHGSNNQRARKRNADGPKKRHTNGPSQSVDSAEMRCRRLIKNREYAERSRARSRVRLASLQQEVEQYRKENAMLRQKKLSQWRALEHGNVQAQSRHDKKLRRSNSCSSW